MLDAIDREGSYAAAGQAMHRATSAVSYAVQGLEQALGLKLFEKVGRRARLTVAGRRVLEEGRRLLGEAERLGQLAMELKAEWEADLGLVVDGSLPMPPVMRAVRRFNRRRLPTRVRLKVAYLGGVREWFDGGDAHVMLTLDVVREPGLVATPLPKVDMLLVAHREHPLAALKTVGRGHLAEHVELAVEDSARDPSRRTQRLHLGSPHLFRLSDFYSKKEAILHGVGFGWMPRHLVEAEVEEGSLCLLPFDEGPRQRLLPHLVYRRRPALGPAAELLLQLYREALTE